MANTYTQITIHLVFAVQNRECLISSDIESNIHKYITGIFNMLGQKMICINGMPDHVHILFGQKPDSNLSEIVRDIKRFSTKHINDNRLTKGKFSWQEGYSAFSYAKSQRDVVINYIMNQKEHHKKSSFKDELIELLKKFEIEYNEEYLFKWIDCNEENV